MKESPLAASVPRTSLRYLRAQGSLNRPSPFHSSRHAPHNGRPHTSPTDCGAHSVTLLVPRTALSRHGGRDSARHRGLKEVVQTEKTAVAVEPEPVDLERYSARWSSTASVSLGTGSGSTPAFAAASGSFEQVARGQADDVLVGIDDVLVAEFPEPRHAGGRGGFDADALLGQVALGRRYLIVADGDGGAARPRMPGSALGR